MKSFISKKLKSPKYILTTVYFRTIVALGHLVLSCNHQLYSKLIDYLVNDLSTKSPAARSKTSIQCIAAIWYNFSCNLKLQY